MEYNERFYMELLDRFINKDNELLSKVIIDEPRIFRHIPLKYIDEILTYTEGKLNLDHIIYSSCNSIEVFTKVLDAINVIDNILDSEFYDYFLEVNYIKKPNTFDNETKFIIENMIHEFKFYIKSDNDMVNKIKIVENKYSYLLQ